MSEQQELKKIRQELKKRGWLLESDSKLPSIVTVIVGMPVKGSWWGHAKGNLIYNTCGMLDDEKDVICMKLINGKRTYVCRHYWNLISNLIDSNYEQLVDSVSNRAQKLLHVIETKKSIRSDRSWEAKEYAKVKPLIKELEKKLLCYSQSVHTKSGFHVTKLSNWKTVFKHHKFKPTRLKSEEIVQETQKFKSDFGDSIRFPWD